MTHPQSVRAEAIRLSKEGLGSKKISNAINVDPSLIRRWVRSYRAHGEDALLPYRRHGKPTASHTRKNPERQDDQMGYAYRCACETYANSLEPVASIARRYGFDYHALRYHVMRYRPDLVEQRNRLKTVIRARTA